MKRIREAAAVLLICLLMFLLFLPSAFAQSDGISQPVNIYFFWGDGCPHCEAEKPFLESLADKYPQVKLNEYEVYYVEENHELLKRFADQLGFEVRGVPVTIIGTQYWIGYREAFNSEMEEAVQDCVQSPCEMDVGSLVLEGEGAQKPQKKSDHVIQVPILGEIDLGQQSLAVSTAIIGFVDGFNPCSLWVLSVLLAITMHSGSRKKIITVGLTFLIVTTFVYGLFIAGVFTLFSFVGYLKWIQILVALIAIMFGLVNMKDYLWYKEGISFTISEKHKHKLYKNMRSTVADNRSILGLIGSTAVLAVGVSLIEFSCTAGFPVIWSNLMIANQVTLMPFLLLLGLYMLIYLIDELAVFASATITMRVSKFEEKHGRLLKLISGVIMLALGLVMAINPEWMNDLYRSLLVFAAALAASWAVYIIHQKILPRFGVYVGTGLNEIKMKNQK